MTEQYAIECRQITKAFGSVVANDKIDLTVRYGEIMALLGENGSGKTTLMNMLSGIYHPDAGSILVGGKEVSINSPVDSRNLGIGMIHQHFKLVDVFSAMDNIVLGTKGKRLGRKALREKIEALGQSFGLEIEPEKKVYDMSVSEKQTVEIIKLNGSIELAPIVGLSEVICDIVETGSTLRENGLVVLEEVCPLSARMVVNQVSMKMENERITKLIADLKREIERKDLA